MPLFDSLSSGAVQVIRLAKMTSIPTTDDLRYALEEAKKKKKPVELPFEHPHTRQSFSVRVQLGMNTAPPLWTFIRGEGASAKVLWSRPTIEIMTIQNKVKTESASVGEPQAVAPGYGYSHDGAHEVSASQAEPQYTQPPVFVVNPFENAAAQPPSFLSPPSFMDTPQTSFNDMEPVQPADQQPAMMQPPGALGGQYDDVAPMMPEEFAAANAGMPAGVPPQMAQPLPPPVQTMPQSMIPEAAIPPAFDLQESPAAPVQPQYAAAPAPEAYAEVPPEIVHPQPAPAPQAPVPQAPAPQAPAAPVSCGEPIQINWNGANVIALAFADQATGFSSMNAIAFFLLRSWDYFQKNRSPCSVVVFQIAIHYPDGEVVPLPDEALKPISARVQSACSPLDCMAHYASGEFITLLPATDSAGALEFCRRLFLCLTETPLLPDGNGNDLARICMGASTLPESAPDPDALVNAARRAKVQAIQSNQSFMVASAV